jgi:peroxiredoxin
MLGTLETVPPFRIPKLWALLVVAAACMFVSCSGSRSAPAPTHVADNRKLAPDFTLKDANGASVKLSDYRGKVVLLNFWATWCGPCTVEIPWFVEFEQQYKSQGLEVVGVSMDEDGWTAIKPFVAEHKMNYRVLLGTDSVSQLYGGVESLPTSFIIDRDGKFAFSPHVGLIEKDEYLNEIQKLLGSKQTSASRRVVRPLPALLLPGTTE